MMYVNTHIHTQTYKLKLNTTVYIITYRNVSTVAKKFIKKNKLFILYLEKCIKLKLIIYIWRYM